MKKFLSILLAVLVIGACATTDASAKKRVTKGKKATKTAVTTLNKDFLDGTWISINDIRGSVYTFSYDPVKKTISGTCSAHGGGEWNVSGVVRGKTIILNDRTRLIVVGNRLKDHHGIIYEK